MFNFTGTHMTKLIPKLVLTFIILLTVATGSVSGIDNQAIGTLELVDISDINVYVGSVYDDIVPNATALYNDTSNAIELTRLDGEVGEFFIGGLYPATDSIYTFDLSLDRDNQNSQFYILTSTSFVIVQKYASNYKIYSNWENDTGVDVSESFTVPTPEDGHMLINISVDESERINTISYNDTLYISTPFKSNAENSIPYPLLSVPVIHCKMYVPSGNLTANIYNFTQSIPRNAVTAYSNNNTLGFGLDNPHDYSSQNGTAHMIANGQTGTAWVDVRHLDDADIQYVNGLLSDGWELGIHLSTSLNTVSLPVAYGIIDSEVETVSDLFGVTPSSWCSQANEDNASHAIYAYDAHNMIWRNGYYGISSFINVGNLHNATWDWWDVTSNNRTIYPTFTHEIDFTPAILYSLDAEKFLSFSDTYASNEINITGFTEYYKRGIAQNETEITMIENETDHVLFEVDTNGYPCNINVYVDGTSQTFEAIDGQTYYVTSESVYIQPTANFVASVVSGATPFYVTFVDTSIGSPTSWAWNFGDGSTSTEQNPTHVYTEYGTYSVSLTVSNGAGSDILIKPGYIKITGSVGDQDIGDYNATVNNTTIIGSRFTAISPKDGEWGYNGSDVYVPASAIIGVVTMIILFGYAISGLRDIRRKD